MANCQPARIFFLSLFIFFSYTHPPTQPHFGRFRPKFMIADRNFLDDENQRSKNCNKQEEEEIKNQIRLWMIHKNRNGYYVPQPKWSPSTGCYSFFYFFVVAPFDYFIGPETHAHASKHLLS